MNGFDFDVGMTLFRLMQIVFVNTCFTEEHPLSKLKNRLYVTNNANTADDITRGKNLKKLIKIPISLKSPNTEEMYDHVTNITTI